ncbi:MAG: alginate O-acetyltransferase complex protein AlgI [Verrucomicrobiota bacterium]|jgi:alginate O-acetyltransferase complex protein AlgI
MLFVEFRFFWFFLAVFCVYWSLRENRARKVWLLLCSYVFYAAWDWRFLFLLMGSSALDYFVGRMLARTQNPATRRRWLILSLSVNLGTIALFKYCNFFISSAAVFLAWLGLPASLHTLNIIIPVGVSFYTFHSMSYTIDVYRGKMRAVPSILDVACFIGFFPQMVAGPIVRAVQFLPQLRSLRKFSEVDIRGALVLFLVGFVKKACIADGVAPSVDKYFDSPANYTAASAWLAILFYAIQIYCDFSGYTDMAIACARLLGYELTLNFNFPYLARNIADFWHRWHISLSSWLRDYLYIPLGGNRGSRWFVCRNIMITMLLGGLWHGGAWTFVIWGGLHGMALVVHREWQRRVEGRRPVRPLPEVREGAGDKEGVSPRRDWQGWLAWAFTFYWVCFTWIFFRATDLEHAKVIAKSFVFWHSPGTHDLGFRLIWIVIALGIVHRLNAHRVFSGWWRRGPSEVFAAGYGCAFAIVLLFIPPHYAPFIYFQF